LERIAALLQELIVERRLSGLLGLLLRGARAKLRLRSLKGCPLPGSPKASKLLTSRQLTLQILRPNALLTCSCLNSLLIRALIEGRDGLRRGKALLTHEGCTLYPSPVAAKGTGPDRLGLLLSLLLSLLLLETGSSGINHRLRKWILIALDLLRCQRTNTLRAGHSKARSSLKIRLGHPGRLIDVLNTCLLRRGQRRNESTGVLAVCLKRLSGGTFRSFVNSAVTRHNLGRNLNLLCSCS
jgi:hypothetical protein